MGTKSISFQNWGVLRYGYCSLVLYTWTRNPVFLWNTHSKDGIRELTMSRTGVGGLFWGELSIVPHRWGRKAYILYFHLLITYRRSPSHQCQLNGKNEYVLQGTIHLHSSFLPICVNCKVQRAIVYGLAIKKKKWKRGWSERRKELKIASPILHLPCMSLICCR